MIGYAMLGTRDQERANAFYDRVLGLIGGKRVMRFDNGEIIWGNGPGKPMLAVGPTYDGRPATVGNGSMLALEASSRAAVDALHAAALAAGGTCEGPPGVRGEEGPKAFYGAYFRDPDGHKLCAYRYGPA